MTRSRPAQRRDQAPPAVDHTRPATLAFLRQELAPRPGRLANTFRMTAITLLLITISEIFRTPDAATSAYVAFIVFKDDADATVERTILGVLSIVFGILTTVVLLMATLSQPALRLPLMAAVAFAAMFLSRASRLGQAAYGAGFFMFYSLTEGDNLLTGALSSGSTSNVDGPGVPDFASMAPEEALVHNLLWLALAFVQAGVVVVVINKLTGTDPELRLRNAIADRLSAAAAFCRGDSGARDRMVGYAREGTSALFSQNDMAAKLKKGRYEAAFGEGVIRTMAHLVLVLLAFKRLPAHPSIPGELQRAGAFIQEAEQAVRTDSQLRRDATETPRERDQNETDAATTALLSELAVALAELGNSLAPEPSGDAVEASKVKKGGGLFKPDAFTNPVYTQFALKVTLAAMTCYLFINLSDWSNVDTCITTCFVLSLDNVGQTIQKMTRRIIGALLGGTIGFLMILFVMPFLTDIGQLLCVMAPVIMIGAWIKAGSERTNYVGQQIAFAFFLMMLQDFGPTLHFETGRDRVVGILIGEVVIATVFIQIWPVSVEKTVRKSVAEAFERLADLLALDRRNTKWRPEARAILQRFNSSVSQASAAVVYDPYEPDRVRQRSGTRGINARVLSRLQALAIPIAIVADFQPPRTDPKVARAVDEHAHALAGWLRRCATWVRGGEGGGDLASSLPCPTELSETPAVEGESELGRRPEKVDDGRIVWFGILDDELRKTLTAAGFDPRPLDVSASDTEF